MSDSCLPKLASQQFGTDLIMSSTRTECVSECHFLKMYSYYSALLSSDNSIQCHTVPAGRLETSRDTVVTTVPQTALWVHKVQLWLLPTISHVTLDKKNRAFPFPLIPSSNFSHLKPPAVLFKCWLVHHTKVFKKEKPTHCSQMSVLPLLADNINWRLHSCKWLSGFCYLKFPAVVQHCLIAPAARWSWKDATLTQPPTSRPLESCTTSLMMGEMFHLFITSHPPIHTVS